MDDQAVAAPFTADTKIGDLTVQQFVDLVRGIESSDEMQLARQEFEMSKKIFSDVENLVQVSKPFRITGVRDLHDFVKSVSPALEADNIELAVAVAVVRTEQTTYKPVG